MKFQFKIQQYQTDAVDSVVNVFSGQRYHKRADTEYVFDKGEQNGNTQLSLFEPEDPGFITGYCNADLDLNEDQLRSNIQYIQGQNNIKQSEDLIGHLGACSLDIEMETGTGKTYCYIKTIFELNKRYGWSKFMVVVPSIAIREGVYKTFDITKDHFMEHYGKKARFFIYNSKKLSDLNSFSTDANIQVMIINIQAFNARADVRRIKEERDDFASRKPIDVIAANHPILILDEPQKMGGSATQVALEDFQPLFTLNYSATHRDQHNLVYVLDALDAYNKRLVKKIQVKGFEVKNLKGTDRYLFLDSIITDPNKPPKAKIEFEIGYQKSINRETRIVEVGSDLYALSQNMEQYKGYIVSEIDPAQGVVRFTNGEAIVRGEVIGDVTEKDMRRIQIRETILSHFEKERRLFRLGIKTLSLFFIDEVRNYRIYDEEGNEQNGLYGLMFEQEYNSILSEYLTVDLDDPYQQYLRSIDTASTHAGYFSIDKKGHKVDSSLKRGSDESDDISAYDLILKNKELLLSFDSPVRFIFSHSALREGWDNPNVFQICTLKHGGSSFTQKRQEVGRGLRLCVDQTGERYDAERCGSSSVHDLNVLTVVASEGYQDFVGSLQTGIKEALYDRPSKATKEYFTGKTIMVDSKPVTVEPEQAGAIYRYLVKHDYIDDNDNITLAYHEAKEAGTLAPLPEALAPMAEGVQALIQSVFDPHALPRMIENGNDTDIKENKLNENFAKKEFQTLWNYINHKYAYTVSFDSDELIKNAAAHINEKMYVTRLQYTVSTGTQAKDLDQHTIERKEGFERTSSRTETLKLAEGSEIKYDLIGKIADGTKLTRRTVAAILSNLQKHILAMFRHNPEEFIHKAVTLINEQKATMVVENISYNVTEQTYDSEIFTAAKCGPFAKAYRSKKNIQDYVFTDGSAEKSVEWRFAEDMDVASEVCVYAKLPKGFQIPTPVGNYSPDWAIAFNAGTVKHIFFVAETKGSMSSLDIRPIEGAKIACAKRLFNELSTSKVRYHEVSSYQALLDRMNDL